MTTKNVYRNKPQFETNPTLNKNLTPNVPEFHSNAMDNQGLVPLSNCSDGCYCGHEKAHKENSDHECCHRKHAEGHKDKKCNCDHK
ncbi:hypothetical protein K0040_14005 [Terrisporobacter petrolearius]|uniref:hypothetical protein n=1 Tax=Terrisporobacter petrolearius TaxID=1460447 RepID=UPI001D16DBA5|nr:hypothetical protein [Terrisporobacter petrolearius]MCC3865381.1 hypothetical protein [Terrisporobacter petrolearius]